MSATTIPHDPNLTASEMDALREYGCLTDAQLARATGKRVDTVRKQMARLEKSKQVQRFDLHRGGTGRPIKVSCLPETQWTQPYQREHQLLLNDVRLAFHASSSTNATLKVRTWDTQRVTPTSVDSNPTPLLRPDATREAIQNCGDRGPTASEMRQLLGSTSIQPIVR